MTTKTQDRKTGSDLQVGDVFKTRNRWYKLHRVISDQSQDFGYRIVDGLPAALAQHKATWAQTSGNPDYLIVTSRDTKSLMIRDETPYPVRDDA